MLQKTIIIGFWSGCIHNLFLSHKNQHNEIHYWHFNEKHNLPLTLYSYSIHIQWLLQRSSHMIMF